MQRNVLFTAMLRIYDNDAEGLKVLSKIQRRDMTKYRSVSSYLLAAVKEFKDEGISESGDNPQEIAGSLEEIKQTLSEIQTEMRDGIQQAQQIPYTTANEVASRMTSFEEPQQDYY